MHIHSGELLGHALLQLAPRHPDAYELAPQDLLAHPRLHHNGLAVLVPVSRFAAHDAPALGGTAHGSFVVPRHVEFLLALRFAFIAGWRRGVVIIEAP